MTAGRSRDDLLRFLDYLAAKGLTPPATANARKSSANKVFGILDEEEASDIFLVDLDEVMQRFVNLNGQSYTPKSLSDYRSRVRSSLEDFRSHLENPLGFKPSGRSRSKPAEGGSNGDKRRPKERQRAGPHVSQDVPYPVATTFSGSDNILPIPLRSDVIVRIHGLPFDLTPLEARKVSNIVLAHALPD